MNRRIIYADPTDTTPDPSATYSDTGVLSTVLLNAIKKNANNRNNTNHTYFRHSTKLCKYLNSLNIVEYVRHGYYVSDDFIIE